MKLKERVRNYFTKKSKLSIASDLFFVLIFIMLIVPQGRMQLGIVVNKVKSLFIEPDVQEEDKRIKLADTDYEMLFQCPPCVAEMPSIQKLYDKYKGNDEIAFLMVSGENAAAVKKFVEKRGFSFPVYINRFKLPDAFYTENIPTTFVISKSGQIVIKEQGAFNWSAEHVVETMDKLINEE